MCVCGVDFPRLVWYVRGMQLVWSKTGYPRMLDDEGKVVPVTPPWMQTPDKQMTVPIAETIEDAVRAGRVWATRDFGNVEFVKRRDQWGHTKFDKWEFDEPIGPSNWKKKCREAMDNVAGLENVTLVNGVWEVSYTDLCLTDVDGWVAKPEKVPVFLYWDLSKTVKVLTFINSVVGFMRCEMQFEEWMSYIRAAILHAQATISLGPSAAQLKALNTPVETAGNGASWPVWLGE